jgi:hypothetical protein
MPRRASICAQTVWDVEGEVVGVGEMRVVRCVD